MIECFQEIPCNPCVTSCKNKAIIIGKNINNLPKVIFENCVGCGMCVFKCPGQAIMLVDGSKSKKYLYISVPYEFYPIPEQNQMVKALDREGKYLMDVRVEKVKATKVNDKTIIVTLEIPRELMYQFRNFALGVKK